MSRHASIIFDCEVVTPMFIGNAIKGEAELRAPAIKAALRFWWRALYTNRSILQMEKEEVEVFGGSYKNENGVEISKRSKILLSVKHNMETTQIPFSINNGIERLINKTGNIPKSIMEKNTKANVNILEYLAFGAVAKKIYSKYFHPKCDELPNNTFKIIISFKREGDVEIIKQAMLLCSIFGGLGARSRNGYGRFKITNLPTPDINKYIPKLFNGERNSFTSFSKDSVLIKYCQSLDKASYILEVLGRAYILGRVKFHDHNNKINTFGLETEHEYFERPYISSPVVADRVEKPLKINIKNEIAALRHPKCQFFGILKHNEQKFEGYILSLPYNFLAGYSKKGSNESEEHQLKLSPPDQKIARDNYNKFQNKFISVLKVKLT